MGKSLKAIKVDQLGHDSLKANISGLGYLHMHLYGIGRCAYRTAVASVG